MNSRHLETLLWVVRLGGIGAAAHHLNLTQPAVTRRIQELEKELRAPLFRREGRNIVPTPMARECAGHAERILAEVVSMRISAAGQNAVAGTVRAGVSELIALTWLDRLLARTREAYPNLTLEIDVDLSSRLGAKLARRQLDIVFVPGPLSVPGAVKVDLGSCAFGWMASPRLFVSTGDLAPSDLAELPVITLPQEADVYSTMTSWFEQAGVKPRRLNFCNSFSVVVLLVRKGFGVSLLPCNLFAGEVAAGSLVVLPKLPKLARSQYSAAYLPQAELAVLPQIAAFARDESWFLSPNDARWHLEAQIL
jgi:DNA-binding transcriptional LysR family regulator